jgi:hypothetical protein
MAGTKINTWVRLTPERRAERSAEVREQNYQRGIARHIREIAARADYLTDELRAKLRELADAQ